MLIILWSESPFLANCSDMLQPIRNRSLGTAPTKAPQKPSTPLNSSQLHSRRCGCGGNFRVVSNGKGSIYHFHAMPTHNTQHTTHNTQHTTHNTQHTTHNTQHTTHNTQHTTHNTHNTQHTTHNTQHTTHNTQHTTHTTPLRLQQHPNRIMVKVQC